MKNIKQLSAKQLAGKTVIVRVDFNVPFKNGKIIETFRIDQSWPTIDYLLGKRAKVLLVSHLGDEEASLLSVAKYLSHHQKTKLATDFKQARELLEENNLVLLENLRLWPGEKNNDKFFAKELSGLGDLYVNDAFSVSHRLHASVIGLPKFLPSYAGLRLMTEIKNLERVTKPKLPLVVILGGAKFKTKIPLIKKLSKADKIFLGGALANSFFKAQDLEVGLSVRDEEVSYIKPFLKKKNLRLPIDVIVADTQRQTIKNPTAVLKKEAIFDIGPETLAEIAEATKGAKTVLWNGPLGWFEKGYTKGTLETAKILAKTKAFTVVGGGDTLAAIKRLKLENKFGFISTGGGAMLDYIASGGKLAGLKMLE
ncbi:MAG TPA: phosphoglycerate kinase [Candidatus Paceibacterota bacterium]|nr:phosphoglycerate kinase [Candidatus Paceibacterota bacterium]HOH11413.1 phosphoglycerate kinase [Candidatus Paceibacterota bacterium]HOY11276.1 phosphoglycerate kinase [Candidatus Paceibacterota bacterium]HPI24657.1 phosphoglycerate kinase [Candidatus Paceibacterota bacterium]HPY13006.1 phosphoglycerate kinase [Candidatus Paceibacterota bacterium]